MSSGHVKSGHGQSKEIFHMIITRSWLCMAILKLS